MGAFGIDTGILEFTQVNQVVAGFDMFNVYKKAYTKKTYPVTMGEYKKILTDFRDLKLNDFSSSPAQHNYLTAMSTLNSEVDCTNDLWVLVDADCNGTQEWASGNGVTVQNDATPICININTFVTKMGHN